VALADRLLLRLHGRVVLRRVAVFVELGMGIGAIRQQRALERRQGLRQRIRQIVFVRLFRQLRLAQLDEGVDQGAVALRAQPEQALVDRTPVVARSREYGVAADGLDQAFAGERRLLRADQRQLGANALL